MAKYVLAVLLAAAGLFSSCSRIQAYYHVASGNYKFERGDYQDSNVDYFLAKEIGLYKDEVSYNLGNLYHSLGEDSAAAQEWNKIPEDVQPYLSERVLFNRGVLHYEKGEYQEAYDLFRKVLTINPSNTSAKINLEYALKKLSNMSGIQSHSTESAGGGDSNTKDIERVFQYIRNKQEGTWRSSNQENSSNVQDW